MLVQAAWALAKAPGPLRAFFIRTRTRKDHQAATVAVARKLAVLGWHLLTKDVDYLWARPALVAKKVRGMEIKSGQPIKKDNKPGKAHDYYVKTHLAGRVTSQVAPAADLARVAKCDSLAPPKQNPQGARSMEIDRRDLLTGLAASSAAVILPPFPAQAVATGVRRFEFLDGPIYSNLTPPPRGFRSAILHALWHFDPNYGKPFWLIRHVPTGLICRSTPQEYDRFAVQAVSIESPLEAMISLFTPALSKTMLRARRSLTRSRRCSEPITFPASLL